MSISLSFYIGIISTRWVMVPPTFGPSVAKVLCITKQLTKGLSMNNQAKIDQALELFNQFEDFLNKSNKPSKQSQFKAMWDAIVMSTTTKQYFTWHNLYFKGDLSYRHMAESMKKSTTSIVLKQKCDTLLNLLTEEGF